MNSETRLILLMLPGLAMIVAGLIWLIVAAFRKGWLWGLGVIIFLPLVGPIFLVKHRRSAAWPVVLMVVGVLGGAAPIVYNKTVPVSLGPLERMVGDELHITLTKWDRTDYSVLQARPSTVVLQMANPDVTDATLTYLQGMEHLRELDLTGTQVSDAGLEQFQALPALESIRLKGTKITDAGFQKWLAPRESLVKLDLRDTLVTKETGKAWKAAKAGRC